MTPLLLLLALATVPVTALGYVVWRVERAPAGRPQRVRAGERVLLCLGDSITQGRVGAAWVPALRERLAPSGRQVANGGRNGAMAWNVARRLEADLACRPDAAVLLIGTNDLMAAQDPALAARYRRMNRLPRLPDLDWSLAELDALVATLAARVPRTALCTVPPLGEDPEQRVSRDRDRWNDALRRLAERHGCALLDLAAALDAERRPERRPWIDGPRAGLTAIFVAAAKHYLLGRSWDAVAEDNGFGTTIEGIHLSDRSAAVLGELVAGFARDAAEPPTPS